MHVITDQLPFPPRNGISLPLYNYCLALRGVDSLRLGLLSQEGVEIDEQQLAENEKLFGEIEIIRVTRRGLFSRISCELFCVSMFQQKFRLYDANQVKKFVSSADSVLVSPYSAVAVIGEVFPLLADHERTWIAAVNDCTTAEYYTRCHQVPNLGFYPKVKGIIDRIRSIFIGCVERKSLANYSKILLQTNQDKVFLQKLVSKSMVEKVVILPNGVGDQYRNAVRAPKDYIVFVGELSGEYDRIMRWFLSKVWSDVVRKSPGYKFKIVGRGASDQMQDLISRCPSVTYEPYIPSLVDLYSGAVLAVSPVFKGFGLINKTIEAMAAGVPVVGGVQAFNGVDGFVAGRHGFVCSALDSKEFARVISRALADPQMLENVASEGRMLISNKFRWVTGGELLKLLKS